MPSPSDSLPISSQRCRGLSSLVRGGEVSDTALRVKHWLRDGSASMEVQDLVISHFRSCFMECRPSMLCPQRGHCAVIVQLSLVRTSPRQLCQQDSALVVHLHLEPREAGLGLQVPRLCHCVQAGITASSWGLRAVGVECGTPCTPLQRLGDGYS